MVPSDPRRASPMVMSSHAAARVTTPSTPGLPGSSTVLSPRAVPSHPGEPVRRTRRLLRDPYRLHHLRQTGHPRFSVTRPNRVRSRYSSRRRLPRLRPTHCWTRPLGRLHVQPTIYMADSFQPARTARLGLAHRRHKELFICALCARNSSLFLRVFVSHACRSRTGSPPKASARRRARRSW